MHTDSILQSAPINRPIGAVSNGPLAWQSAGQQSLLDLPVGNAANECYLHPSLPSVQASSHPNHCTRITITTVGSVPVRGSATEN